jgi:hypothetical protein
MDREAFYRKLVAGLTHEGFHVQAGDSSQDGLASDSDRTSSAIRQLTAPFASLVPQFDRDVVQRHIDMVRAWAAIACFKYSLAQPIILAVIEADRLTDNEMIAHKQRFDQVVLEMRAVTATLEVPGARGVRMGSFGILLFVFFDPEAAARFAGGMQKKCKCFHIFKKTYVLPWLIDVAGCTVRQHRGLPFLMSTVLNTDKLQNEIFGDPAILPAPT